MDNHVFLLRRRNRRIDWRIPIIVTWSQGEVMVREQAHTENVSASGARIILRAPVPAGKRIQIAKPGARTSRPAQVMWRRALRSAGKFSLGVELEDPNDHFWVELAR